jgi:hypothetical protein
MQHGSPGWWRRALSRIHCAWIQVRQLVAVLAIVRFSLLIPTILAVTLVAADQMIDILRALGEERRRPAIVWLLMAAALAGLTVWYTARTMLRFRFASNPTSDPAVHPCLKRLLPRLLGIAVPGMLALRMAFLAWGSRSPRGPWILTAALAVVTAVVGAYVFARRRIAAQTGLHILAAPESQEQRDLQRWRDLPDATVAVVLVLIIINVAALALFTWEGFYQAGVPAHLGAPAILLLSLGLTAATGSALVYMANRYAVPIITLLVAWAALCSLNNDNHMVRVTSASWSHGLLVRERTPQLSSLPDSALGSTNVDGYFEQWWQDLVRASPPGDAPIPVFIVAAEGGGLRAAYWTATVLAELEDATSHSPTPFSRHLFAISGVSGGSVGAVLFDAMVTTRAGRGAVTGSVGTVRSRREEMEQLLAADYLSDTLGNALFPDLLQRFLPMPIFSDRAVALEHTFEYAWSVRHPRDALQLTAAFHDLWRTSPHSVPLLFLNSTVVETGQRAINFPLATHAADPVFADSFGVGRFIGTALPLSTAALLSARFTYVSPAGLIDTRRTAEPRWIRLVDGGYFDNSGAVTAQEVARSLLHARDSSRMRLIVLHLPNEAQVASAQLNEEQRSFSRLEFLSEMFAPIQALLNTRGARGTQAVSYLRAEPGLELLSIRPCRVHVSAPLGWVLSSEVRHDMSDQLSRCDGVGAHCAAERLQWVEELLNGKGDTPYPPDLTRPPQCAPTEKQ